MSILASDGLILRGTLTYPRGGAGKRSPLAVLAHQYPSTHESFAPLTADLLALGYATLAFDQRGHGKSTRLAGPNGVTESVINTPKGLTGQDFADAFISSIGKVGFSHIADDVVRVASWGAAQNFVDGGRILLCGASVGGTGVLLAAPRLGVAVLGVLTLGAAAPLAHGEYGPSLIREQCRDARVPHLLTSSRDDAFDGANNVRTWADGAPLVTPLIVGGDGHAMAIYFQVRMRVMAFARSVLKERKTPLKRPKKTR
ncbi:MAG: alpha/beta fold hydrolase [Gemmatimonadaceae bacterium]